MLQDLCLETLMQMPNVTQMSYITDFDATALKMWAEV